MTRGHVSDDHGSWSLSDRGILTVHFNYLWRIGRPALENMPLHPTLVYRGEEGQDGAAATWVGEDDKGAQITMTWVRSRARTGKNWSPAPML